MSFGGVHKFPRAEEDEDEPPPRAHVMDEERRALEIWLPSLASLCTKRCQRGAYIAQPARPETLKFFEVEDIPVVWNAESHLTHWLMRQVTTYDPSSQVVVGLAFEDGKVLAQVLTHRSS